MKVNFCHHLWDPFSQGKAKLSPKEKCIASLGLFLLPLMIIPGLATFYGISYYFKNKALRNLTTPSLSDKYSNIFSNATSKESSQSSSRVKVDSDEASSTRKSQKKIKNPSVYSSRISLKSQVLVDQKASSGVHNHLQEGSISDRSISGRDESSSAPSNRSSPSSESELSDIFPLLQGPEYAIDFNEIDLKTQKDAANIIFGEDKFTIKGPSLKFPVLTYKCAPNGLKKAARFASSKFVDTFQPAIMKENKEIDTDQFLAFQIKRVGLVFGLKGKVKLPKAELSFAGSYAEFTLPMIAASFSSFYQSLDKDHLPKNFQWLTPDCYKWIQENLKQVLSEKIVDNQDIQNVTELLRKPDFKGPVITGSGFDAHDTVVGFIGKIAFIINRGFHSKPSGVAVYTLKNREVLTYESISDIVRSSSLDEDNYFGHKAMVNELGGDVLTVLKMTKQDAANCSYRSVEGLLCTLFTLQYLYLQDPYNFYDNLLDSNLLQQAFNSVTPSFEQWVNHDRRLIYDDLEEDWREARKKPQGDPERVLYEDVMNYVHNSEAYLEMCQYERRSNYGG